VTLRGLDKLDHPAGLDKLDHPAALDKLDHPAGLDKLDHPEDLVDHPARMSEGHQGRAAGQEEERPGDDDRDDADEPGQRQDATHERSAERRLQPMVDAMDGRGHGRSLLRSPSLKRRTPASIT
jgi:hypothetical protein